jgi:hypothetical protein
MKKGLITGANLDPVRGAVPRERAEETPKSAPKQPSGRSGKSRRFGNRCPNCGSYFEGEDCGNCQ